MQANFSSEQASEFLRRHNALVAQMKARGIDHYVVTSTDNIFYLTGATFDPLERPFFLVISESGKREFVLPLLEREHLKKAWGVREENIHAYREFPAPEGDGWEDRLLGNLLANTGFAFEEITPWNIVQLLQRAGGVAADLIGSLRLVKSPWEITQIERAARYADWGLGRVLANSWQGGTFVETYLPTQQLQRKIMREVPNWDPLSSKVLAAAWPAPISAEPHSVPPFAARLGAGPHVGMVLTRVNGYAAESERTFFTRTPSPRESDLFALLNQARNTAYEMVKPGVACAEIDGAVNRFLGARGYADFRVRLHRCGHGFGLGNHEPPWIAEGSRDVLQAGMVISIEPGIYIAGEGGYRHSDTVLVTETGYRKLTNLAVDLASLTLPRVTLRHRVTSALVKRSLNLGRVG